MMNDSRDIADFCTAYEIVTIVHELHNRGFEQLRFMAGISPSGLNWRWFIYPKVFMNRGNYFEHHSEGTPFRCIRSSTGYDKPRNRPHISLEMFVEGKEKFMELARGKDVEYVKWYENIVEHAKNNDFPIAFAEYFNAEQWRFMSGEDLSYPPYESASIDRLSDELIIEYAKFTFDIESSHELDYILSYNDAKMNQHEIANVIRQAIREEKGLISHLDVYETKRMELLAWGDIQ